MRWDIFCRVIDNHGDLGVCWRLGADLVSRGESVRLWVDDPAGLQWMAPVDTLCRLTVVHWRTPEPALDPGDVVIEAFGCHPPASFVERMAVHRTPPRWINLEYLSAEDYVERSHGLPSPVLEGPGRGLLKRFFYPGFTSRTGGLLREPGLLAQRQAFDRDAWLQHRGWARQPGEQVVVLFCYADPVALPAWLAGQADTPTLLLVTPGHAIQAMQHAQAHAAVPPSVRWVALPYLHQPDFDRLLWSADLNFVRGEDSFVRAQWAGAPFVWQIYPQDDGVHAVKLHAFLDRMLAAVGSPAWSPALRGLWSAWNGLGPWPEVTPPASPWARACRTWRDALAAQPDLTTQLLSFAALPG